MTDFVSKKEELTISGENYVVGIANERFFFAWGWEYTKIEKAKDLPKEDILDKDNGIEWFDTKDKAIKAYLKSIENINHLDMGNNIKKILKESNLSIRGLSKYLKMSYSSTHNLVNRASLAATQLETLIHVAEYLDTDISSLY